MKDLTLKIRLLFLPFLMVSAGLIIIYTFLHWWLILKLELFQIDEMYTDYWIPAGLIGILLLFFVRKKINLMNLTSRRGGDWERLYYIVAMLAFGVPTVIAQVYIRTSTGELKKLASPELMDLEHRSKYYQFDSIYLDKRYAGLFWYTNISGKNNSTLNFHAFFALPLMSSPQDTNKRYFNKWIGFEYKDQMSNRKDELEKEAAFRRFQQSCMQKYGERDLYQFVYFDRIGPNDLRMGLQEAVKVTNNYDHTMEPIVLHSIEEPFEERNGSKLEWMLGSYTVLSLLWLLMILYPSLYLDKIKG